MSCSCHGRSACTRRANASSSFIGRLTDQALEDSFPDQLGLLVSAGWMGGDVEPDLNHVADAIADAPVDDDRSPEYRSQREGLAQDETRRFPGMGGGEGLWGLGGRGAMRRLMSGGALPRSRPRPPPSWGGWSAPADCQRLKSSLRRTSW